MYDIKGYSEAETVREAMALLTENPGLIIIAGGTDVLVKLRNGKMAGAELLSIRRIKALEGITGQGDGILVIGPLTTFAQLAGNEMINERVPVLAEAALSMGGPQIRNVATIGGNICNGATSADSASTLMALNARLKLQSVGGERVVPIREFYLGPGTVDLKPGEILTGILIAREDYEGYGGRYIKFAMREAMDIATLGVSVLCKLREKKVFDDVRIGLGVAAPTPIRCGEAEAYAAGKEADDETIAAVAELAVKATRARTSWRASKEYREHLVEELTKRALRTAVQRAGGAEIA